MNIKNYSLESKETWSGRIDDENDFDSFRWHQWVELIDLNDENLKPFNGEIGFGFLGFQSDLGIKLNKGRAGAANGPEAIRRELSNLPCQFNKNVKLFDCGNISTVDNLEESQDALAMAVERILSFNLMPILLGGGHEIAFGHYKGISQLLEKSSKKNLGIINFDAHFDLRPYKEHGTSGTMFRQIADYTKEKNLNYSYFCLGIQKHSNTKKLFEVAEELGVEYILAKDIVNGDYESTIPKLDMFIEKQDYIYATICSDVFSTAFAPGVSAPQPLGLDPEMAILFLKHIIKSKKLISFDIAEVSPRFDSDNTTANLAAILIFTLVITFSEMKFN
ncbi:formiminoglutamase [Anaerosphaera aminiphila DSM 21120]|uniref:Formimidoylglutamase n=1 Tax=Anaerosphaera aminiphila DSM 21120 TaxID=1120995 RepID=A0A1M5U013_9FIRM|nr:formimidoylglutamase [Anaerosphaera aminiphila]SHH56372.1 formiminoglutamase [Anaerosphaera aminiphila DSM 21120]